MAQPEIEQRKLELISRLESQREEVDHARDGLAREMSLSLQVKRSVRHNPIPWALGAAGTTAFLTLLLRRPRGSGVARKSKLGILVGLGFTLAKPALTKWAVEKLKGEATKRLSGHPLNYMLGENR